MKNIWMKAAALLTAVCLLCVLLPAEQAAQADVVKVNTIGELKNYIHESMLAMPDEITLEYDEALQPTIEAGDVLDDMLNYSYGVEKASWNWSWEKKGGVFKGTLVISPIEYFNGIEIIKAWKNGTIDQLTNEQQQTFQIAQQIAKDAYAGANTMLDVEIAIHDEICRRAVYTLSDDEGNSVIDTAVGALLYGTAECDGYSDAFYLIGTLAGLNIGFQTGSAVSEKMSGAHLWNVIEIDGTWYHVDVTWDDLDDEYGADMIRHTYLNVGSSLMGSHTWDETLSPYIVPAQTNWDYYYYTREGHNVYCVTLEQAAQYIASCREKGMDKVHVMVKGEFDYQTLHDEMYDVPVYGRWMTWSKAAGGYTFFEILFLE